MAGGINTYAYVSGNPVNYVDPFGLDKLILLDSDPFLTTDSLLLAMAKDFADSPDVLYIVAHGNNRLIMDDRNGRYLGRERLTAEKLASIVKSQLKPGMKIKLVACETANGTNSFAEQLFNALGGKHTVEGSTEPMMPAANIPNPVIFGRGF